MYIWSYAMDWILANLILSNLLNRFWALLSLPLEESLAYRRYFQKAGGYLQPLTDPTCSNLPILKTWWCHCSPPENNPTKLEIGSLMLKQGLRERSSLYQIILLQSGRLWYSAGTPVIQSVVRKRKERERTSIFVFMGSAQCGYGTARSMCMNDSFSAIDPSS